MRMEIKTQSTIWLQNSAKRAKCSITSLKLDDSPTSSQDFTSSSLFQLCLTWRNRVCRIETSSQKTSCLTLKQTSRLPIMDFHLSDQSTLHTRELEGIWLLKLWRMQVADIVETRQIFLLLLLSFSSWFHDIPHSEKHRELILITSSSLQTDLTFSGDSIVEIRKEDWLSSETN